MKFYSIFVTVCSTVILICFAFIFHKAGYDTKLLFKLGLKEPAAETTSASLSWNTLLKLSDLDADIVFFGDSITRGSDFRQYFPDLKIINMGFTGDSLVGMINRVPGVVSVNPEKVFVLGGINGLTDFNLNTCISIYEKLIDTLSENLPDTQIYIQSVLPISSGKELSLICHNSTIKKFNKELEQLAKEKGLTFIDLYSLYELNGEMNPDLTKDGIHLYSEAYSLWAEKIAEYMK